MNVRMRCTLLGALALPLLLAACGKSHAPASNTSSGMHAAASAAPVAATPRHVASIAPSRQTIPTFKVEVTLSNTAAQAFAKSGETVIVAASFFADPKPGTAKRDIDEIGQVDLGGRQVELHGAGTANFDGSAVARNKLHLIAGAPQVNINVWSGRHTSQDNLLGCDMFQGSIAAAARKPVQLHCALLTESYATKAVVPPASDSE